MSEVHDFQECFCEHPDDNYKMPKAKDIKTIRGILRLYEEHIISILEDKPVEETLKIGLTRAQTESQIKALIEQNYISKDRLPSIKELENIIEKTAVEYNKNKITPDFIWKCSLTDLAKAIKVWWEGK